MAKFNGFEPSPAWTFEFFQNHQIWAIWAAKVAKFNGFESSPAWTFEFFFKITKFEPFGLPKWLNLVPCLNLWIFQNHQIWAIWAAKVAKFNGFESSPAWTLEFFQNHQIWAIWAAKVAKFNGFESSPAWTFEFFQNHQIWAIWVAKVAKFNGFESPLPEPLNFFKIAKFEPFGLPKWLNLTVLNPLPEPLIFFKITKFEPFGLPKWLNLTVLNPPLPEPLNFFKITKFEPFGVPKRLNLTVLKQNAATLGLSQRRKSSAFWGAKLPSVSRHSEAEQITHRAPYPLFQKLPSVLLSVLEKRI